MKYHNVPIFTVDEIIAPQRIYIAGPMRGYPEYNFPAFNSVARYLRNSGYEVENPAEKPEEALLPGFQEDLAFRRKIFRIDCEAICSVDIVALLPFWNNSSGARAEKALAEAIGLQVRYLELTGTEWCMSEHDPFATTPNVIELTDTKPTNPKDAIGIAKTPMSAVPAPVLAEMGLGMMEGALKYGRHNYRAIGVRASVYYDATMRHLMAWWEGEDIDADSGLSHITKAIVSLVVLRDAMMQDRFADDRPPHTKPGWLAEINAKAKALLEKYPNPVPAYTHNDV